MGTIRDRLAHAWHVFTKDPELFEAPRWDLGSSQGFRPDRIRLNLANERTIIASVYNHIAIDAASIDLKHVRLNDNGQYLTEIASGLNNCLTVEANIDQAAQHFLRDIYMSLFDRGVIAVVPVETTINPMVSGGYDIQTMRVGTVVQWYPKHVRVLLYNDLTGNKEEVTLPKNMVAIIENPLYSVMNEVNSTLRRLVRKLSLLDSVDEQASSGKLDLIIQLPYVIKSETRRQQAEQRQKNIEMQLKGSRYGIAYTDATERITQLNRPAENNLLNQITLLTTKLYAELGLTEEVFNGTADEQTMLNYFNRTIEPVGSAVRGEFHRQFLTKTARS